MKFPLGIQSFEKLRKGEYLYVDKTALVYQMTHDYSCVFLSRPRRFGKSLLASTLECYLSGQRDLFKGLAIEKLETKWVKHPVLHFDLSGAKLGTEENLNAQIDSQLRAFETKYHLTPTSEDLGVRLGQLIQGCVKQEGQPAVVLIDEYDAPIISNLENEQQRLAIRNILRNFYTPLKMYDRDLRFVFITGITKFTQLSIFSELNNLKNISMLPDYTAICGITQNEMDTQLHDEITQMATAVGKSFDETEELLKSHYDGYHFSKKSEDVYNPYSLLNALSDKDLNNYWFATATPSFLVNVLQKFKTDITRLDCSYAMEPDFDASIDNMTSPLPLLYQSGYLTIKDYNPVTRQYLLGYPNKEVESGLINTLLPYYVTSNTVEARSYIVNIYESLEKGLINDALDYIKTFLAGIPYSLDNKTEKHYQTILYVIFKMLMDYVEVEVQTATGRIDLLLQTSKYVYVMEFKLDGTAEQAMQQINDKQYALPFESHDKQLIKVGVNFSSQLRNIDNWKTEIVEMVK